MSSATDRNDRPFTLAQAARYALAGARLELNAVATWDYEARRFVEPDPAHIAAVAAALAAEAAASAAAAARRAE